MPQWFTFVVPNYFQSTVRHRPETPSLVDEGDETVESDAKDIMNPSASNQVKALISASSSCGTLGKLPLELRTMIYTRVLGSEKYIKNPHKWLDRHPPIMAKEAEHIKVIDAALLRTCRTIYQEALQILYGRNRFNFYKSEDVTTFAHFGLGETPFGYHRAASEPSSAVSDAPYGRLTMVSRLHLRFAGGRSTSWSSWCNFFYPPEKHTQLIGFPALQRLSLDLVEWQLGAEDASMIRVTPFLRKLRPTGGLKHLTLVGVKHEQNLREFKHGFVKEGGTFRPAPSSVKTVPDVTVTHDDLPEVSMYVRAIVDKDRAARAIK